MKCSKREKKREKHFLSCLLVSVHHGHSSRLLTFIQQEVSLDAKHFHDFTIYPTDLHIP